MPRSARPQAAFPASVAAREQLRGSQTFTPPQRRAYSAAADKEQKEDGAHTSDKEGEKGSEGAGEGAANGGGARGAAGGFASGAAGFASAIRGQSVSALVGKAKAVLSDATVTAVAAVKAEVRLAMMDEAEAVAERQRERSAAAGPRGPIDITTSSVTMIKEKPKGAWGRRLDMLRSAYMPVLQQMSNAGIVKKVGEIQEDIKDRWETSESPVVHKLQDLREGLRMEETTPARAMAFIRERQPDFDLHEFVATIKGQVPKLLTAYLKGDLEALRGMAVSKEMMERFQGLLAVSKADGTEMDSQILDVSDIEVVEIKVHDGLPLIVLQFAVQQIDCVRDRSGLIVEGAVDNIQSVYYVWAIEQTFDSETYTAKWLLREMAIRAMQAIV